MTEGGAPPETVIFDLGGVLIDWDPRYLYRKIFDDEAEMERFLATVCNRAWIERHDEGRAFAEGVAELAARHPALEREIEAFWTRWPEMLSGSVEGTVEILRELKDGGLRLYALSNWSAETWPHALDRFAFLQWFDGLVVSGFEGLKKPDPAIYTLLLDRYEVAAPRALFIDDVEVNVLAAKESGLPAIEFRDAAALRRELADRGLPVSPA